MIDKMLQIIAPHHCCGCGVSGALLCDNCKYDIVSEPFSACLACGGTARDGVCVGCQSYYQAAWCVGERDEALKHLIDQVKFSRARSGAREIADLFDMMLPALPPDTVVVPIPTIPSHVRIRGHAHVERTAKKLARLRNLRYEPILRRRSATVQRGSSRQERFAHAREAFMVERSIDRRPPYLVIDDVFTTGATVHFASRELRRAGASQVFVAVAARQPLDNTA